MLGTWSSMRVSLQSSLLGPFTQQRLVAGSTGMHGCPSSALRAWRWGCRRMERTFVCAPRLRHCWSRRLLESELASTVEDRPDGGVSLPRFPAQLLTTHPSLSRGIHGAPRESVLSTALPCSCVREPRDVNWGSHPVPNPRYWRSRFRGDPGGRAFPRWGGPVTACERAEYREFSRFQSAVIRSTRFRIPLGKTT